MESCQVKGHNRIEPKAERENKGGARGGRLQRKRQTWSRGVSRERMKRTRREKQWNLMNDSTQEVRKQSKGSGREGIVGNDNGCYKSEADVSAMPFAERELALKQRTRRRRRRSWSVYVWLYLLKNSIKEWMWIKDGVKQETKSMVKRMNWYHIFLWLPLLFLSLCPEPGSSQVGVTFKS